MSTNAPTVAVPLQKLVDAVIASVVFNSGASPSAAPNAFKDGNQKVITIADTTEFQIVVTINGDSAYAKVEPIGSMAKSIEGSLNLTTLATKLV